MKAYTRYVFTVVPFSRIEEEDFFVEEFAAQAANVAAQLAAKEQP